MFFAHYSLFIIKKGHYSLIIIPHPDPHDSYRLCVGMSSEDYHGSCNYWYGSCDEWARVPKSYLSCNAFVIPYIDMRSDAMIRHDSLFMF